MYENVTNAIRRWLVAIFVSTIENTSNESDREAAVQWLHESRAILASDAPPIEKIKKLNALIDSRATLRAIGSSISTSIRNYRQSKLPLPVKIAIPATLAVSPLLGAQGVGIAALGGAIGAPALVLFFIGTAGITSIIQGLGRNPQNSAHINDFIDAILADATLRGASERMRAAMRDSPADARRYAMPEDVSAIEARLWSLDPYQFEEHVMGLFQSWGLVAWVTRKSNDLGVDGFAKHSSGLIVVQCKRNSPENKVGGPKIREFKGVIEEQGAWRGYVVTTSTFTQDAVDAARLSDKVFLVDLPQLVDWHKKQAI